MLAVITSHAPTGIEGQLVTVEVDIRRGLPGIDVIGLPDGAVRESKERVRVAIRNSGFSFPPDRILVSLAPAGLRKQGASYDLSVALGILLASGQVDPAAAAEVMVLGELNLSGAVKPVNGVLSAVGTGLDAGIKRFLVPRQNVGEAGALGRGAVHGIGSLREAADVLFDLAAGKWPCGEAVQADEGRYPVLAPDDACGDISDIRGHKALKRALEIAAAGRHHLLLFGPPGSGKTLAARRIPVILPPLTREESLSVTRIHSMAGILPRMAGLVRRPPFRMPHHSASSEGIIGGGKGLRPGEVSLAHHGILFLDEAPEFGMSLLQSLREPTESGAVSIVRAGAVMRFAAGFQLVLAMNPCPCGNLGRDGRVCICTRPEIYRYWRRIGGALLDRIDIRVPVDPVTPEEMSEPPAAGEGAAMRDTVLRAVQIQRERFAGRPYAWNSRMPPAALDEFCGLDDRGKRMLIAEAGRHSVSSRGFHSILRVARTIADLADSHAIREDHVTEAVGCRKYGDNDFYWSRC